MKITKSQLKQIIKEELSVVLNETADPGIISTVASYLMETGAVDGTFEEVAEIVRKMSDDKIVDMHSKALDYFSKQGGSP